MIIHAKILILKHMKDKKNGKFSFSYFRKLIFFSGVENTNEFIVLLSGVNFKLSQNKYDQSSEWAFVRWLMEAGINFQSILFISFQSIRFYITLNATIPPPPPTTTENSILIQSLCWTNILFKALLVRLYAKVLKLNQL